MANKMTWDEYLIDKTIKKVKHKKIRGFAQQCAGCGNVFKDTNMRKIKWWYAYSGGPCSSSEYFCKECAESDKKAAEIFVEKHKPHDPYGPSWVWEGTKCL
jgi:hypothetical protein